MLQLFRTGWLRIFFLAFLVMGAAGLILMDWQGVFTGTGAGGRNVASIGNDTISATEFNTIFTRVARGQRLSAPDAYQLGMADIVLQQDIQQRVLAKAGDEWGVRPGATLVVQDLIKLAEQQRVSNPNLSAVDAIRSLLRDLGMSERDLMMLIQRERASALVQKAFAPASQHVVPALAAEWARAENQTRTFSYTVIEPRNFETAASPTDETLKAYYQTIIARFALPERRTGAVAVLDANALKKSVTVTDADIAAHYETTKDKLGRPETRLIEQALLPSEDAAQKAKTAIDNGASFKDAVAGATDDKNALQAAASFAADELPDTLREPYFAAAKGAVAGPVKGPFGWHLAFIKDITPPSTPPLSKLRDDIRRELTDARLAELLDEKLGAYDAGIDAGDDFETLTKQLGFRLHPFSAMALSDAPTALKGTEADTQRLADVIFDLLPNEPSPLMEMPGGFLAAASVSERTPPSHKPFDDVKADVLETWRLDQARKAAAAFLTEQEQYLEGEAFTMADVAAKAKATASQFTLDGMNGKAPDFVNDDTRRTLWQLTYKNAAVIPVDDGFVIVQATALSDPARVPDKSMAQTLASAQMAETGALLFGALQSKYRVSVNRALLDQMYRPAETAE